MIKYLKYRKIYLQALLSKAEILIKGQKYRALFETVKSNFNNKYGLEIGGPTTLFSREVLPIYKVAKNIDGCNFSNVTIWEGDIFTDGYHYAQHKTGKQFISEGSDLTFIENETYDFVVSSHNLEHIANPIKALTEWLRILKPGGTIMLILPDKRFTFDRKRQFTTLSHFIEDYENKTGEDDLTHLPEILATHDLKMDPGAGEDVREFEIRCRNNFTNRCLHHHVFNLASLQKLFEYLNIKTVLKYFVPPVHQVIIGRKV